MNRPTLLRNFYHTLLDAMGPSHWWPGDTPFEIAVGAVLTQNTNWKNVELAIATLRREKALSPGAMAALPESRLAELVRPSGYFRIKAARMRSLLDFLASEAARSGRPFDDPDLKMLASQDTDELRPRLLGVRGVGPETADSILLYALKKPIFVVDAYTRRILSRHMLVPEDAGYQELQEFFMDVLPPDPILYNEYHALIVRAAKSWCRAKIALCEQCPLSRFLE